MGLLATRKEVPKASALGAAQSIGTQAWLERATRVLDPSPNRGATEHLELGFGRPASDDWSALHRRRRRRHRCLAQRRPHANGDGDRGGDADNLQLARDRATAAGQGDLKGQLLERTLPPNASGFETSGGARAAGPT